MERFSFAWPVCIKKQRNSTQRGSEERGKFQDKTKQTKKPKTDISNHSSPEGKGKVITLLETNFTFPEAKATAVSAITSAFIDPKPPVALVLMKLSSTTSRRSVI